jgi:hypothetical protein
MKKKSLFFIFLLFATQCIWAQSTELFETETNNATSFTDAGQTFNITSQGPAIFNIQAEYPNTGWNGTAKDNRYIDNSGSSRFRQPVQFTISAANGTGFTLKSVWLFVSNHNLVFNVPGSLTITGKLAGVTKYNVSANGPFNTSLSINNGFTFFNMASFGGQNNANTIIDEYVITTTDELSYVSLDAMQWQCAPLTAVIASQTNTTCYGANNGSATVSVTGGAVSYDWAPGNPAGDGTATVTGLSAGVYTCTVRNTCGSTATTSVTITQPAALTVAESHTNIACYSGTGSATVTPSGGAGDYIYLWSTGATSPTVTGLVPGNYSVVVQDANDCSITRTFTITQPSELGASSNVTNVSCYGGANGAIAISPSGGTAPYTYSWSNGANGASVSGLIAGSYTVTITDSNSCSVSRTITVTEPTQISVAVEAQGNVSCSGGSDGYLAVSASGGTGTYTYIWSTGTNGSFVVGLSAGIYSVMVIDSRGCNTTRSFTITQPESLTFSLSQTNILCNGGTATATVTPAGGTVPYSYMWSTGATGATVSNLSPGTYTVGVTDASRCTVSQNFTVTAPDALTVASTQTEITCTVTTGSISLNVAGGTAPYSYSWSNGSTAPSLEGVTAGSYSVTVTDNAGCTAYREFNLEQPETVSAEISHTDILCKGSSTGTAAVTVDGGAGPYTYSWTNGAGNSASATNLAAGSYLVTVTDVNGCTVTAGVEILEPAAVLAAEIASQTNNTCFGNNEATATVVATGGVAPYTYSWSNGAATASASGLEAGTYTVIVTDANGCSASATVTITQPSAMPNDSCAGAELFFTGTTAASNICGTPGTGLADPSCTVGTAVYDTWYKFNSGANTQYVFDIDMAYAVYCGDCNGLTEVVCAANGGSLTLGLNANTTYYIRSYTTQQSGRRDFTISLSVPCIAPADVQVEHDTASGTLSWSASASLPSGGYQYEVRTSGEAGSGAAGLVIGAQTNALSAVVTGLTADTYYSVYVRSLCGEAVYSSWTTGPVFFTGYCTPAPATANGSGITNVTFADVNNTTGAEAGSYGDYTALSGNVFAAEPVNVTITIANPSFAKIWVDWNNDQDFTDEGELVYNGTSAGTVTAASFNVPGTASVGAYRMRIGTGNASSFTPCYTGSAASFEDYTLTIVTQGPAHIRDNQCGAEIAGPNVDIFANFVPGNTMYRFRVTTMGADTQVIETANAYFRLSMLNNYAYGLTYLVDVSVQVGGEWSDYGKVCRLTTKAIVPQTQLTDCGASVGFNTAIYAQSVSQATTYRFKVTSAAGTVVLDRPTNWFALSMLPSYSYSTAYTVSVDVLASGMWAGYGTACNITSLGQLPSTQLRTCGTTPSYSFGAPIYATTIAQAQVYRFTVTSIYGTETIDRNTDWFTLNMLSQYDYNTTYSVSVTVSAPGVTTSAAGTVCTVSSLATPPVTKLRTQDCGQTVSNKGVYIYANTVPGVATYRFEVTSTAGVYVLNRAVNYFKLSMIPNVNFGETVAVRVQTVSANGAASAYGDSCTVTLTNNGARQGEGTEANEGTTFKAALKGYPNPFTESFGLDLTTNSDEQVSIVVYDMLGKLVDKRIVNASQIPELRIGDNFAAGVYNLILTQGETVKTLRVVKNNN